MQIPNAFALICIQVSQGVAEVEYICIQISQGVAEVEYICIQVSQGVVKVEYICIQVSQPLGRGKQLSVRFFLFEIIAEPDGRLQIEP